MCIDVVVVVVVVDDDDESMIMSIRGCSIKTAPSALHSHYSAG
jgi:hypothetical protein